MAGHEDDFEIEPVRGMPERPPEGEQVLWQGAPDWRALALDAFKLHWIAAYFGVIAMWRFADYVGPLGWEEALTRATALLALGAVACGLLALSAYAQAKATVYTLTNRRVIMRIGAALNVTLNLPYRWVGAADLHKHRGGTGSIALTLLGETRLSYLVCWPHVRPWRMSKTVPMLRCVPNVDEAAEILGRAAETRLLELSLTRSTTVAPHAPAAGVAAQPRSGARPIAAITPAE